MDNVDDIRIGSIVTWRAGGRPKPDATFEPLGIANCEVLKLGIAEDTREPAARIRLPYPMGDGPVVARLADLYIDDRN